MMDFFDIDPRFRSPVLEERRLKKLAEEKKYQAPMPPNTLTNADGTPYSAGYDSAIDEQKEKAYQYAKPFTEALCNTLIAEGWVDDEMWNRRRRMGFKDFMEENLEAFAQAIIKETQSQ